MKKKCPAILFVVHLLSTPDKYHNVMSRIRAQKECNVLESIYHHRLQVLQTLVFRNRSTRLPRAVSEWKERYLGGLHTYSYRILYSTCKIEV